MRKAFGAKSKQEKHVYSSTQGCGPQLQPPALESEAMLSPGHRKNGEDKDLSHVSCTALEL